jgi:hypothetical protein
MYEIIRTFSPIFRGLNFENPRAAAIYYVNLIINFPTNLQNILNEAQTIYGNEINRQALYAGRQELLKNGIIARTYFTEDADVNFDREMYLPVNPEIIWDENRDKAKTYWKQPEEMDFRKIKIKRLYEYYLMNFKKYGLGTEKGSVTGLCNIHWFARVIINIYDFTMSIDSMINALELFMIPDYSEYYEKAFKRGMTQRMLYDMNIKRKMLKDEEPKFKEYVPVIEQRRSRLEKLRRDYHEQINIRYTPIAYTTARQAICYNEEGPYLAIDLRKLLSLDPKALPYYIGTFYLQKDLINHIKENFEAAWVSSTALEEL